MEFETNSNHSTTLTNRSNLQSNRKAFDKQPR
jgi:hypothetical protein